ncbi:bactofilin family protein [Roseospira navarrensis]|uniref:Polymer-forming cytoskeletal protein n=1 Tax=Roseospira navarrensis TaxID=140058 RepID=A0A7X2D5K4_9PROT|nr:polymer-forming cytoskeletal protein [Roseospira navarrensis]MQX37762.1 hypothetical protein [Roseospira navarrensis]
MTKSVFSADLQVYGDVTSKGDLDVHGHVEGSVSVKSLTVARSATIEGSIRAASAEIAGRVDGVIESDRVAIESTGTIVGTVSYKTLSMKIGGGLDAQCVPTPEGSRTGAGAGRTSGSGEGSEPRAVGPARTAAPRGRGQEAGASSGRRPAQALI